MRSDTYKHLEDCTLLRVNAQTAREGPYRHRISIEEADDVWAPHLYLYVFRSTRRAVWPRASRGATCSTARKNRIDRDYGGSATPSPKQGTRSRAGALLEVNSNHSSRCRSRNRACRSSTSTGRPHPIGRGQSTEYRPAAAWLRCFRFFAYKATKFHLLERVWPHGSELTTSYRLVAGHECPVNAHWRCLFAFFAFDSCVPNANQYTIQQSVDGYDRLRVGMTASIRPGEWDPNDLKFYAYDVPVPGTAKFSVQYRVRDGTNMECEQNRLSIDHAVGPWVEKFVFYGYPAPTIELEAPKDEGAGRRRPRRRLLITAAGVSLRPSRRGSTSPPRRPSSRVFSLRPFAADRDQPSGRMRAAEHAPRGLCRLLERRHGLAEVVERGAGVQVERPRVSSISS